MVLHEAADAPVLCELNLWGKRVRRTGRVELGNLRKYEHPADSGWC